MNHRTRIRLLQSLVGLILVAFVTVLAWMLLHREAPPPQVEMSPPEQAAQEALEEEEASQISTGFQVTRTREGERELTVQAERLLGLEGDVYRLDQPTLESHHEDGGTTLVTGRSGTFDMETGAARVEGAARAVLRDGMVVESELMIYGQAGGEVLAEGKARFRGRRMEGEGERLRYRSAGGGNVVLEEHVRVRGDDPEGSAAEGIGAWILETSWLVYLPGEGTVRTREFELESAQGVLGGERLLLNLEGEEGRVQRLLSTGSASLRIPLEETGGPPAVRVITGDEIEMEPAQDRSGEPGRLLATGGARLRREGGDPDSVQDLRGEEIEWFGAAGGKDATEGGRVEARGEASLFLGSLQEPSTLTASVLEAEMDEQGELHRGHASAPVRYSGPEGTARAREADLEDGGERIVLRQGPGGLAVLDLAEGRISGRRIDLWRIRGEMVAEGEVRTLHMGGDGGEGLFQGDEPVHGTADRVRAFRGEGRIRYEGAARLWQEGSLLQADEVEIRREDGILEAHGRVSSRSMVAPDDPEAAPRPVAGTADHLLYDDGERRAVYTGAARLEWGEDLVEADEIQLFLDDGGKVERLIAHGGVEMLSPGRHATGDHLDYRAADEEAILHGGEQLATAQNLENQQVVRGETLTIDVAGGRIQVDSGPGGRTWITLSPGTKSPSPAEAAEESREREASGEGSLGTSPGH